GRRWCWISSCAPSMSSRASNPGVLPFQPCNARIVPKIVTTTTAKTAAAVAERWTCELMLACRWRAAFDRSEITHPCNTSSGTSDRKVNCSSSSCQQFGCDIECDPPVGAVYDRPRFCGLHSSQLWTVIDPRQKLTGVCATALRLQQC